MGSGVTLDIHSKHLQFLDGAIDYARLGALSNWTFQQSRFCFPLRLNSCNLDDLLYDPQTSGGLLISLPEDAARTFLRRQSSAYRMGSVLDQEGSPLQIQTHK